MFLKYYLNIFCSAPYILLVLIIYYGNDNEIHLCPKVGLLLFPEKNFNLNQKLNLEPLALYTDMQTITSFISKYQEILKSLSLSLSLDPNLFGSARELFCFRGELFLVTLYWVLHLIHNSIAIKTMMMKCTYIKHNACKRNH